MEKNQKSSNAGLYSRITMSLKAANALVIGSVLLLTILFLIAIK